MKIKIRRLLIGLSVVMLAMALLALAMMSMRDEMQTQTLLRAYALTTRLAFEEGMLKESVLRTRFGVDTNYDALASNLNAIESGGRELVDLRLPQPVGGMVSQLARTQRVERKQALEFETLNAVLHNSLDYFLYRMQQVLPELPDSGPNRDLQHALGGLVIEIVQRTLSPHPQATDAQASRRAEQLLERAAEALPQDGNVIRLMARHVALIDANAPLRAATMESIVNSSSRPQLLHIGSVIDREIARRDLVHGRERIAALGLLTLLVGTLLGLGVRYVGALRTARDQGVFLRELNDNLATGVLVVGNDDRITFANVAAEKMLGYVDGGLAGRLMHVDVHVKDDGAPMRAQDCALHGVDTLASQNSSWYELTFRHSDGHLVPVLSHAAYYPAKAGGRTIVSFDDLSEQLKSASTLRKLSQAVEQNPASIVITDLEGRIEYVNQAFVRNSGYSLDEAIGQNSRMLQSGKTPPERFRAMWETLASGGSWSGELINRRKDGSEYVEFIVIAPVRQPDGQVSNYIAVKNDITQQKAAEQKIQQLAYFDTLTNLPNRRQLLDGSMPFCVETGVMARRRRRTGEAADA
jgi:PAS domain S-box-containing protein